MILQDVMRRRGFALIATVVVALVLAPCQIRAQIQKEASKAAANEMAPDRAFLEWLDALRAEARRRGISESTLNAALNDIAPVMRVIELDRNQPEFTQTFWTYLRMQVNDHRIKRGRALLSKHLDLSSLFGAWRRHLATTLAASVLSRHWRRWPTTSGAPNSFGRSFLTHLKLSRKATFHRMR